MDMPPLHVCHALTGENEILKEKYRKLTRKYKELEAEMRTMKEEVTKIHLEKQFQQAQGLESTLAKRSALLKPETQQMKCSTDKLLTMHDKLLKQLEKENKQNTNQARKLHRSEMETDRLRDDLFKSTQQNEFLKRQLSDKDIYITKISQEAKKQLSSTQVKKFMALKVEKSKLLNENIRMKEELKGLDQGFFEEIEDMKYALLQSAKLNSQYEKAIKKLCKQFGVNYTKIIPSAQPFERKPKS